MQLPAYLLHRLLAPLRNLRVLVALGFFAGDGSGIRAHMRRQKAKQDAGRFTLGM
jgi:hypothetical protein